MTRRTFLKCLTGFLLASGGIGGAGYGFMQKKMFGALPDEELIKELMRSSHYYQGEFHNLVEHAILSDKSSTVMALLRSVLKKRKIPHRKIPCLSRKMPLQGWKSKMTGLSGLDILLFLCN